jgi:hypothetical protein
VTVTDDLPRGDSPETELTNANTTEKGWPARVKADDSLVWIVRDYRDGLTKVLVDRDDNHWLDDGHGRLVPRED